jgi:hypothetical protein
MPSIKVMGQQFAADAKITREEAQQLVEKAKTDGVVSAYEKKQLNEVLTAHKDLFEPGAADLLKALLNAGPAAPTSTAGKAQPLTVSGAARPVFVAENGSFVTAARAKAPKDNVELGDGLFRAAALVDDSEKNPFADLAPDLRGRMLEQLTASLAKTDRLDQAQASQLRSSVATNLLALAEASPEAEVQKKAVAAYLGLVENEPLQPLRESMVFSLHRSDLARTGETKKISDELMREIAPLYPPYDKWFANGGKTVNMEWTVGEGQFWNGFTNIFKKYGF